MSKFVWRKKNPLEHKYSVTFVMKVGTIISFVAYALISQKIAHDLITLSRFFVKDPNTSTHNFTKNDHKKDFF